MKKGLILVLLVLLVACSNESKDAKNDKTQPLPQKTASKVIALTDDSFKSEVLNANKLVVVDFWAAWCGPCRMIKPYIEELATEFDGKVKVASVDVDQYQVVAQQLNITSIPAVFFFKDGKVVEMVIGARSKADFKSLFEKHI